MIGITTVRRPVSTNAHMKWLLMLMMLVLILLHMLCYRC